MAKLLPLLWTQMRKGGELAPSIGPAKRLGPSRADKEEAMLPRIQGPEQTGATWRRKNHVHDMALTQHVSISYPCHGGRHHVNNMA